MAHVVRNCCLLSSLPPPTPHAWRAVEAPNSPSLPERQQWGHCQLLSCPTGRCFSLPCSTGKGGTEGRNQRESGEQMPWFVQNTLKCPFWQRGTPRLGEEGGLGLGNRNQEFALFVWLITIRLAAWVLSFLLELQNWCRIKAVTVEAKGANQAHLGWGGPGEWQWPKQLILKNCLWTWGAIISFTNLPEPFIFWLEYRPEFPKLLIWVSFVLSFIASENCCYRTTS